MNDSLLLIQQALGTLLGDSNSPWVTLLLSLIVGAGFIVLAVKWYLQRTVKERALSNATKNRLIALFIVCEVSGMLFYCIEATWIVWRMYDLLLAGVAVYCWWHAVRGRGTKLIDEKMDHIIRLCENIEAQKKAVAERDMQARHKSFLLNSMSHDLRTPLNSALLNAQMLKILETEPMAQQGLDSIMENVSAAGNMVSKLLEYAKAGSDDINQNSLVDLSALLTVLERRFVPLAGKKNLFLIIRPADVKLITDAHKLERVIANLIDNAIKYTLAGGIIVSVTTSNTHVTITIKDTGIGIPPESVPHLFDEFYQVEGGKGFGLGLSICRSLARQIGGDVVLETTGDQGSCFSVTVKRQVSFVETQEQRQVPAAVA